MSDLELRIKRELKPFRDGDLDDTPSEAKAITEMISRSGLQYKTVAIEIGVDAAVLSKAKTGQARLSEKDLDALMDACGSELWLRYWMKRRGYDPRYLRRIESDVERENRELREELERVRQEREVEIRYARALRAAA